VALSSERFGSRPLPRHWPGNERPGLGLIFGQNDLLGSVPVLGLEAEALAGL
jgi:hypothetical protein